MIRVELLNCKTKLQEIEIDMDEIGSGARLSEALSELISYVRWEYIYIDDNLNIFYEDNIEIPDLSMFGDVVEVRFDGNSMG